MPCLINVHRRHAPFWWEQRESEDGSGEDRKWEGGTGERGRRGNSGPDVI